MIVPPSREPTVAESAQEPFEAAPRDSAPRRRPGHVAIVAAAVAALVGFGAATLGAAAVISAPEQRYVHATPQDEASKDALALLVRTSAAKAQIAERARDAERAKRTQARRQAAEARKRAAARRRSAKRKAATRRRPSRSPSSGSAVPRPAPAAPSVVTPAPAAPAPAPSRAPSAPAGSEFGL